MSDKALEYQLGFSEMHREEMYDVERRTEKARKTVSVMQDYARRTGLSLGDLSLLDIGCSTGLLSRIYGEIFGHVTGVDIDAPAVEFAQRSVSDGHIEFHVRDSMHTGFPENHFDAVTCTQVYEHVPDSNLLMAEIFRVLKPGGFCYFAAGNRIKFIEAHYKLPLLSVIPKWLAHWYVRAAGKADSYYETHLSYWGLRTLVSQFEIVDYTRSVIADPDKFCATDLIKPDTLKQKISLAILSLAYWACPTYIWILRKPDQGDANCTAYTSHRSSGFAGAMRTAAKKLLSRIPFGSALTRRLLATGFKGSPSYWESRYAKGDNSGAGSYGELANFKGKVLTDFISEMKIESIVDFGCGDGNQIGFLSQVDYVGFDVSKTAIDLCSRKFADDPNKRFMQIHPGQRFDDLPIEHGEMSMSLDVIFHLVEDDIFSDYIDNLFSAATRFVVIYSSNADRLTESPHVRHRNVTAYIETHIKGWSLLRHIENPYKGALSDSDFFIYQRDDGHTP